MTDFRLPAVADEALERAAGGQGLIVFLTGAGISAESGIPTFRGEEGYWMAGSVNYAPMELATSESFHRNPRVVWSWYLYRLGVCRAAEPNAAHRALARLEPSLGDRFLLVSQNVDGLHLRAGNTPQRTYQIHGNIEFMRCAAACSPRLRHLPANLPTVPKDTLVDLDTLERLRCPDCGGRSRPHVLWFDEYYDEELFYWSSTQLAMRHAELLVIVGSSGATNLPLQIATLAAGRGVPVIDVNPGADDFRANIPTSGTWIDIGETASRAVPAITDTLIEATGRDRSASR